MRPYLIQNYPRDMGNGVVIMMREIDAPIRVFGKHWGGFRTAYKTLKRNEGAGAGACRLRRPR